MWVLLSSYCSEYLYVGGVLVFLPGRAQLAGGLPWWLLFPIPTPGWGLTYQLSSYHTKYEMTRQDHSFDEILSSSTVISGLAW